MFPCRTAEASGTISSCRVGDTNCSTWALGDAKIAALDRSLSTIIYEYIIYVYIGIGSARCNQIAPDGLKRLDSSRLVSSHWNVKLSAFVLNISIASFRIQHMTFALRLSRWVSSGRPPLIAQILQCYNVLQLVRCTVYWWSLLYNAQQLWANLLLSPESRSQWGAWQKRRQDPIDLRHFDCLAMRSCRTVTMPSARTSFIVSMC